MRASARFLLIMALSASFLTVQWGCAVTAPFTLPPPLSEKTRAELGTVGVVSARFVPGVEFTLPEGRAEGAATGAGLGAAAMLESGAQTGDGYVMLLAVLLVPVAMVAGGVVGAVKALPAEEVEKWKNECRNILAELNVQDRIRDRFVEAALRRAGRKIIPLVGGGPEDAGEEPDYRSLSKEGIDTVMEISVLRVGLWSRVAINPPVSMSMTARLRMIRTADNEELYANTLRYESVKRSFSVWAADNAGPFRAEFDRAFQSLSEKNVEELFLLFFPEEERARFSKEAS